MAIEIFSPNKIVVFNHQDMNIILPLYMEIGLISSHCIKGFFLLLLFFCQKTFQWFPPRSQEFGRGK